MSLAFSSPVLPALSKLRVLILIALGFLCLKAFGAKEQPVQQPAAQVNRKDTIIRLTQQKIAHLLDAATAFHALPEVRRTTYRNKTATGAYELLEVYADRHPNLVLNEELREMMSWSLHFTQGRLRGKPALLKIIKALNDEIDVINAQNTAKNVVSAFNRAKSAGTKELDDVKTAEEIIQRLNAGVNGGGKSQSERFEYQSTPELAAAAKPHLSYDAEQKTLRYIEMPGIDMPGEIEPPRVGLEGIEELAMLIAPKAKERQETLSRVLDLDASAPKAMHLAKRMCTEFRCAKATGAAELNDVKTVGEAIQKLSAGVNGGGDFTNIIYIVETTPEQATEARRHLKMDLDTKMLVLTPDGMSLSDYCLKTQPKPPAPSAASIAASSNTHAQRTAQQLASVFNAAMATGAKELDDVKTTEEAIQRIITGVEGGGAFKGKQFVAKANAMHVESARAYLRYDADEKILRYSSTAGSSAPRGNEARPQVMSVGREIRQSPPSSVEDIREAHEAANAALAMRNAQSFASVFNAAMAAGSTELDDVRTVDDAMKRMIAGVEGGGPFKGRRFQMEATPEEAAAAKPYLKYDLDQKALFYASRTANTGFMDNRERPSAMPVTSDTPAATTARRNAELFCAVFNAAMVAGAPELESVRTVDDAIERIMAGVHGGGVFKGKLFVVDASPEQAAAAKRHLEFRQEDQMLIYNP